MSIWRCLGFHDFEHFASWCPGCVGIMFGVAACAIGASFAWWVLG